MSSNIGRYEILHEIGRGAMGVVYAARDPAIGRTVAIKTVRLSDLQDESEREQLKQRIQREAQSAGILSHPGIVTIHDIGEEQGQSYIVMEYVEGTNLETILTPGKPQHTSVLLRILRQAAEALDHAHSKGLIHRDIKPSNIMVAQNGAVKIADFGVAKFSASTALTKTGLVMGTPNYMSPEQAKGRPIDGRSDQFSLGVMACRMLTGQLPFSGPTLTVVLTKILWEEPENLDQNLAPEVQRVLRKALSKDPGGRYSNCAEFIDALSEACTLSNKDLQERLAVEKAPRVDFADAAAETEAGILDPEPATQGLGKVEPTGLSESREGNPPAGEPLQPLPATMPLSEVHLPHPAAADSETPPLPDEEPQSPESSAPSMDGWGEAPTSEGEAPARGGRISDRAGALLAIAIGLFALFGVGLLAYFFVQRGATVQEPSVDLAPPAPAPPATETRTPVPPAAAPAQPIPQTSVAAGTTRVAAPPARRKTVVTEVAPPPVTPPPQTAETPPEETTPKPPVRGVLTWSGRMVKNSLLIIDGQRASHGSLEGQFPGIPITLVIEPKTVQIREHPSEQNGWKRLMLYSGQQRYDSITVRWTSIHQE